MQRTGYFFHFFAAFTVTALGGSSVAFANAIYIDDGMHISRTVPTGTPVTMNVTASPQNIMGMAFNPQNDLFEVDASTGNVYEYSPAGTLITSSFISGLSSPAGIAINSAGDLYVGMNGGINRGEILEYNSSGTKINTITDPSQNYLAQVGSLAVDANGDLFEADALTGFVNEFVGGTGSAVPLTTDFLDGAIFEGLAVDGAGDVFVSYWNSTVNTDSGGGIYEIKQGTNTAISFYTATTLLPTGLAWDAEDGNLYMAYVDSLSGPGGGAKTFTSSNGIPISTQTPGDLIANGTLNRADSIAYQTPEPGTITLLFGGLASLALLRTRRPRK